MKTAKRCMIWLLAVGMLSMISPKFEWFGSKYGQVEAITDHLGKPVTDGYGILDDKIRIVPANRTYEVNGTDTNKIEFDIYVKDCPDFRGLAVHIATGAGRGRATEAFLDIDAPNSYGETGMCAKAFSQAPWNCRVQLYSGNDWGRSVLITNTQQSISITGEQRVCTVAVAAPNPYVQICFGGLKLYTSEEEIWDTKGRTYELGVYPTTYYNDLAFFTFGQNAKRQTVVYCHIKGLKDAEITSIEGRFDRFYCIAPFDEKDFLRICDGGTLSYENEGDGRYGKFELSFGEGTKLKDGDCLFGISLSTVNESESFLDIGDIYVHYADGSSAPIGGSTIAVCSLRESGKGFVGIQGWVSGQTPSEPTLLSETNSVKDAVVYYKRQDEADDAYTEEVPTQPGDYRIKAVFPANAEYEEVTAVNKFKIKQVTSKKPGEASIRIDDWTYGEAPKSPTYKSGTNINAMVEYRKEGEENFSVPYPKDAGHYTVRVVYPANDVYDEAVAEAYFTIHKALSPANTPTAKQSVKYSCETVEDVSLPQGWNWSFLDRDKALEVGTPLTVTAVYSGADQDNYENLTAQVTITRQPKGKGVGTVYMAGWTYGTQANTPAAGSQTNGIDHVIYYYKKQGESDASYTQTKPVNAGQYVIKAVFPETDDYTEAEATAEFTIAKASVVPERPKPSFDVEYNFDKVSAITLPQNWEWSAEDRNKALSAGVPLTVTAVYTGADRDNYENLTMQVTITRQPERKSEGTVSIAGWTYGEAGNYPIAESDTNGTDDVTYYYKKQGEDDAGYTQTRPVNAGQYVVKAVFPAKDDYEAVEATAEFTIAKAAHAPGLPDQSRIVEYPVDSVSKVALPDNWIWQEDDREQPLSVRVPYTATAQYDGADQGNYETESVRVTITRLEQNMPAVGYTVTIVNPTRSNITIHSATAEPIQRHITQAMEPVLFVANAEYYFPENYSIAPVNGIMVRRVSDTRIQVYGTPTANATIYLVPASRVDAKSHKVTVVNGTGGGNYNSGNLVNIRAAAAPTGMRFARWRVTQGNVALADEKSAATSFTMKTEDVTVVAEYENATGGNGSGNQNADSVSKTDYEANSRKMNQGIKASWSGNSLKVDWNLVSGAEGYDIYAAKYTSKKLTRCATVKDGKAASTKLTKVNGKKPDKKTAYQVKVKAYRYVDGTKQYLAESLSVFTVGNSNKKYTDAKSVKPDKKTYQIKKKGTAVIKAKLTRKNSKKKLLPVKYVKQFRYFSTNEKIASVNAKGKVKGKKKGNCYVYIVAGNGAKTRVKIQVK